MQRMNKAEIKAAAKKKYWFGWWYCKDGKEAKKIYEDYLVLVRKANASPIEPGGHEKQGELNAARD